jgi:hypothetical protein
LPIVQAATIQYGEIRLTVENRPPRILSLIINPPEAYYDSVLKCDAIIDDEKPGTVDLKYKWYKNDVLLENDKSTLTGLKDNDKIRCEGTPTDENGALGETKSAETNILSSPVRVKIIKPILNAAGIAVSARDLVENTGVAAITGMVTGNKQGSGITLLFLLGIFALILVGLNLVGVIIYLKRRFKYPRAGY